ncbi:MAG: endonuclease/exonuclease/phosphatase family protein [Planctomyces sp.]|nr:endonuclease/exonuclease/phosphatase family protein [Planctomyces sp.]
MSTDVKKCGRFVLTLLSARFVLALLSGLVWPLCLACAMALGVSLFARSWWAADILANLRVQLILMASSVALFSFAVHRYRHGVAALVLGFCHAWWCLSAVWDTSGGNSQSAIIERRQCLRVCTANVLSSNHRHQEIIDQIRDSDADIVAVLELTPELMERMKGELSDEYPASVWQPQSDGNFGIGLLSRLPLTSPEVFDFETPWLPSIQAQVEFEGRSVRVIATHPVPPMFRRGFQMRNSQLRMLANVIRKPVTESPADTILVGDLNLTPWSPVFDDFCRDAGLKNASAGTGLTPTWYARRAFPFGLMLDHGLCSEDLNGVRQAVLPEMGSDHRIVVFDFWWDKSRKIAKSEPEP